jgi:hypothetical protein
LAGSAEPCLTSGGEADQIDLRKNGMLYSETLGRRSRSDRFRRKRGVCIQKRWGGGADQIDLRKNGMLYSETLGRRSRSARFRRKRGVCIQKRWGGEADQIALGENGMLYSKALGRRSRVAVVVTVLLCDCVARRIFIFLSNNCFADNPRRLRRLI